VRFRGLGAYFYRPAFFRPPIGRVELVESARKDSDARERKSRHADQASRDGESDEDDGGSVENRSSSSSSSDQGRDEDQEGQEDDLERGQAGEDRSEGRQEKEQDSQSKEEGEWRQRNEMRNRIRDTMNLPRDCRLYLCPQVGDKKGMIESYGVSKGIE